MELDGFSIWWGQSFFRPMLKTILSATFLFTLSLAYSQTVSTLVPGPSTFNDGLAVDKYGNIFASRYLGSTVTKITPDGQTSIFADGMSSPNGLIFDTLGNLLVPQAQGGMINLIDTAGNFDTILIINDPGALVLDPNGYLIIARYNVNDIRIMDSAGHTSIYWTHGGLNGPIGLLFDDQDNFYVGNFTDGKIFKRTPDDSVTQIGDLPGNLGFMTLVGDDIYATAFTNNRIYRIPTDGSGQVVFAGGAAGSTDGHVSAARFTGPNGITSTPTGDTIYISEYNPRRLRMITGVLNPTVGLEGKDLHKIGVFIFPNPVSDYANIEFSLESPEYFDLKLFSSNGNMIKRVFSGELETGDHQIQIQLNSDGIEIGPGVYFLQLDGVMSSARAKLIVR